MTTHYLEEAEQLADRIAIMHGGRIVRTGTTAQIVAGEPARIRYRTGEPTLTDPARLADLPALAGRPRRGPTGPPRGRSRPAPATTCVPCSPSRR